MKPLSERIRRISASRTVQLTGVIENFRRQGRHIINLGIGEPDEPSSQAVVSRTVHALKGGQTRYGPVSGIQDLREAIAQKFDGYTAQNILVTNGGKQALYTALQVVCNPGDQVIIPRPCWVSFCEQIKLAGAVPVLVDTKAHQLDFEAIERAVNTRTKMIIINSPNNPTGAIYPGDVLRKIADLAIKNDLYLMSDEAYEAFVYDGWAYSSLFDFPHVRDRLVVAGSFSKTHCMTGFRIGYAAAPEEIITAMARLQSHLTGNVCTFVQHGALAAAEMDPSEFDRWRNKLQKKRDITLEILRDLPCHIPRGAFYVFPDVNGFLREGESTEALATDILQRAGVAVAPGEAFGGEGHIRICYALAENELVRGLEKVVQVIKKRTGETAA